MKYLEKYKLFLIIIIISGCSSKTSNIPPTVSVQGLSEALERTAVEFTSISGDADGSISSYEWTQTFGPEVAPSSFTNSSMNFIAPDVESNEVVTFQLTVKDNEGKSASAEISITIKQSLADSNPIFHYHITEEDTQASVFISSLNLEASKDYLKQISFKIHITPI